MRRENIKKERKKEDKHGQRGMENGTTAIANCAECLTP
jgi:hypothetical protein